MKSLQINYLAVLAAAVVTFILGAIWYIAFSESWMALSGLSEEKITASGGGPRHTSLVLLPIFLVHTQWRFCSNP